MYLTPKGHLVVSVTIAITVEMSICRRSPLAHRLVLFQLQCRSSYLDVPSRLQCRVKSVGSNSPLPCLPSRPLLWLDPGIEPLSRRNKNVPHPNSKPNDSLRLVYIHTWRRYGGHLFMDFLKLSYIISRLHSLNHSANFPAVSV